jgi:hypothetical protein
MQQLITPNPDIPCKPGWCLAYVNEAFGVPKRYGSATAAWNGSATKHRDYDFPAGAWVPIWFSLEHEPNGHVALLAPDGSVYSTTDPYGYTPHHHPNIADLLNAYAANNPLTFLGWTEDVEDTPVLGGDITITLASASAIITQLEEAGMALDLSDRQFIQEVVNGANNTAVSEIRAQSAWVLSELAQKIADSSYQIKVFTQNVVNPRLDNVDSVLGKIDRGE